MAQQKIEFVIVTGLSGAGKTQAIRCLEDIGFYCVDNLPLTMIPNYADIVLRPDWGITKTALVIDIREGRFLEHFTETMKILDERGIEHYMLFLEASDEVLIHRFSETRRRHPLSGEGSGTIAEIIKTERKMMQPIRERADRVVDSSHLSVLELKELLSKAFMNVEEISQMTITLMSFGYKYGIPLDADLVFDVRFLPNPYYVDSLRNQTGYDKSVKDYVMKWSVTRKFVDRFFDMIDFLIPYYIFEGKAYLTLALGCTGGKHRSVTVVNELKRFLESKGQLVHIKHRDISR